MIRANRDLLASYGFRLLGRPVQDLRRAARARLLEIPYSCVFEPQPRASRIQPGDPIILTGHQPALYHPGVWLKNFLAGYLARAVRGAAVNLNVDNDEARQTAVRAPVVGDDAARVVTVPYLRDTGGRPYEELQEQHLLDDVAEALRAQGVDEALCGNVAEYWSRLAGARGRGSFVKTITCARHSLEREAGLENLEALVSDVARQPEFRLFVLDILANLERFHAAWNGGLAAFRRLHHEKNRAQPVPDLARDGPDASTASWARAAARWEMPFWCWRRGGARQRLWAEPGGDDLRLFAAPESEPFAALHRALLADGAARAVAQLTELEQQGLKVRPRALTLTLFARLFLGDLFIHGVGGALYDEVTDEIIRRYYGVEPPRLAMATGTALLPLGCYNVCPRDRAAGLRRLRDIKHNPDRLMNEAVRLRPEAANMLQRKRQLIRHPPGLARQEHARRWHELHDLNRRLAALLEGEPQATLARLHETERRLVDKAVLADRAYPLVLHSRARLIAFYRAAARPLSEQAT